MSRLYLDNNSTTPLLPEVAEAMAHAPTGNPASAHRTGAAARIALEAARATIAQCLEAHPDEVVFTSGATEANNLALFGLAELAARSAHMAARSASKGRSRETDTPILFVSNIEHPSIIEPCRQLAQQGFTLIDLPVDAKGHAVSSPLSPTGRGAGGVGFDTGGEGFVNLITLQLANHETGVVQNIADFRQRHPNALFHTDATQAVGKIHVRFHDLGVSTLSFSAHKFHGPVGIGALIVNRCIHLTPRTFGGHQQLGRRPGTEPVALAVGMATALKLACVEMNERQDRCRRLRHLFLEQLASKRIHFIINGDSEHGLPHTLNLSFPGCPSETLFIRLDLAGVDCSTGSACSSGSMLPSPVLQAMRVPDEVLRSSMRFSLSHLMSDADVVEAANRVAGEVKALR